MDTYRALALVCVLGALIVLQEHGGESHHYARESSYK